VWDPSQAKAKGGADAILEKKKFAPSATIDTTVTGSAASSELQGTLWSTWCDDVVAVVEPAMHESTINTKVWPKKPQPEIIFVEPSSYRDATATPFRIVRMPGKGLCASRAIYLSLNPSRLSTVKRNESGQPIDTADREQEQQQIDDMMTT
jgi:hypothetical protein